MEAPKLPTIFKQVRTRGFNYQPVYYSEAKERREELKKKLASPDKPSLDKENFRNQMRAEMGRNQKGQATNSNLRLLVIIMILGIISYLIIIY